MRRFVMALLLASLPPLFYGCGEHGHDHEEDAHEEETERAGAHAHAESELAVRYEEGKGLELSEEIVSALGIKVQKPELKNLADKKILKGSVLSLHPQTTVNVRLPLAQARALKDYTPKGGRLLRFDEAPAEVSGLADLVYGLDSAAGANVGAFVDVELHSAPRTALSIPSSAILKGMNGKSAYVLRDGHYMRTEVKTGAFENGLTEISEGLTADDTVAVNSVEQLWLIELRLTKGGGHSH